MPRFDSAHCLDERCMKSFQGVWFFFKTLRKPFETTLPSFSLLQFFTINFSTKFFTIAAFETNDYLKALNKQEFQRSNNAENVVSLLVYNLKSNYGFEFVKKS